MGRTLTVMVTPPAPPSDRREATRVPASELPLPQPLTCRITPGHDVRIVNASATGLLVESSAPLFPGRRVTLHLQTGADVASASAHRVIVQGVVVRGCMSAVDRERGATFVSAIAFDRRVDLERELCG